MVSLHPGVTREAIAGQCGWPVASPATVAETPPPTDAGARRAPRAAGAHRRRAHGKRRKEHDARRLHLRHRAHADRPLRRRARQGAHRRSRRGPDQALLGAQSQRSTGRARRGLFSAAPTRPARTTATSRAWRCCSPGCRTAFPASRSTGSAPRAWMRSAPRRARSGRRDRARHRRRRRIDDARAVRDGQGRGRLSSAPPRSTTPPSAGASSIR